MRRRIRSVASAVAAAVLATATLQTVTSARAHADEISDIYCELQHDQYLRLSVHAVAYYTDNVSTGLRRWYEFRYRIVGSPGRTSNNVNIRLSESGRQVYAIDSPDNRKSLVWYSVRPASPVYTSMYGPEGPHDHRSNDLIEFEAIFDLAQASDPKCTAWART